MKHYATAVTYASGQWFIANEPATRSQAMFALRSYGLTAKEAERVIDLQKRNPVKAFLAQRRYTGLVQYKPFREKFLAWLPFYMRHVWNHITVSKALRSFGYSVGRRQTNEPTLIDFSRQYVELPSRPIRKLILTNAL